jgi:hypothetical protein
MLKKLTVRKEHKAKREIRERAAYDYCGQICARNCDVIDPQFSLARDVRF